MKPTRRPGDGLSILDRIASDWTTLANIHSRWPVSGRPLSLHNLQRMVIRWRNGGYVESKPDPACPFGSFLYRRTEKQMSTKAPVEKRGRLRNCLECPHKAMRARDLCRRCYEKRATRARNASLTRIRASIVETNRKECLYQLDRLLERGCARRVRRSLEWLIAAVQREDWLCAWERLDVVITVAANYGNLSSLDPNTQPSTITNQPN